MAFQIKLFRVLNSSYFLCNPGSKKLQVISVLHTDVLLSINILKKYEQLASANIILRKKNDTVNMIIRHRKLTGKVIESVEQICINGNGEIVTEEVKIVQDITRKPSVNTDWINKDVTFKLALEDKEKQARNELILPYLRTSKQPDSAEIIYEPVGSDWNEEDPDEDLDF